MCRSHPQLLNLSSLANDCGVNHNTAKAWLSVLEASYLLFLLYPHHRNFRQRLVNRPKLYFLGTGLVAWLLEIRGPEQLTVHAQRGAPFENWVIGELVKGRYNRALVSNLYFWRDNSDNEIDVLLENGERLHPVEIKSGQTLTRDYLSGLRKWVELTNAHGAQIDTPCLVYGGTDSRIRAGIEVLAWQDVTTLADLNAA